MGLKPINIRFSMKNELLPNEVPWFKTKGGIVFLTVIGLVILIFISFVSLVAFYAWKIKYQDGAANLSKEFQTEKFTLANKKITQNNQPEIVDTAPYIREHNPTIGNTKAPITIIAFIDFECPFCRESYPIFQKVTQKYEPVARIIFKHFPITALHPQSNAAANAAACAHEQKKFWEYHDSLFTTQSLGTEDLLSQSKKIGLDQTKFSQCLDTKKYQGDIDQDIEDGVALGVRGTPTFFVNGYKIEGVLDSAAWDKILFNQLQTK
jgi:protein-disulfide isomerase